MMPALLCISLPMTWVLISTDDSIRPPDERIQNHLATHQLAFIVSEDTVPVGGLREIHAESGNDPGHVSNGATLPTSSPSVISKSELLAR